MRKAIGPFDRQHTAVQFFEPQIVGSGPFQAIQVDVVQRQSATAVLVYQCEGRAADVLGVEAQTVGESADERRLPGSKISR